MEIKLHNFAMFDFFCNNFAKKLNSCLNKTENTFSLNTTRKNDNTDTALHKWHPLMVLHQREGRKLQTKFSNIHKS